MTPDPTDDELDEMEQDINALIAQGERRYDVHPTFTSRCIKSLRACRIFSADLGKDVRKYGSDYAKLKQRSKAKDAALELFLKYMEHPDVEHARQLWEKETGGVLLTSVPINQAIAALNKKPDD